MEEEARNLREKNSKLQENADRLTSDNDALKLKFKTMTEASEVMKQRMKEENAWIASNREQMEKEIEAHKQEHYFELADKDKRITQLENKIELLE